MKVQAAGIYSMSAEDYLLDCCPKASLTSGIARELLMCSPLHAWTAHPKLNPAYVSEEKEAFDIGTAAHAFILQGETDFDVLPFDDFRTKAAKEARDASRASGRTPVLAHRWRDIQLMGDTANAQLNLHEEEPRPFGTGGQAEVTLVWQESNGVWCRSRLDWLHKSGLICDYKTCSGSAHPDVWTRTMYAAGLDIQAAFYLRALKATTGVDGRFLFVAQEINPPYALSVVGLAPDALDLARRKVDYAINLWAACLESGEFHGYPTRTAYAEAPPWEVARWEARTYQAAIGDDGRPLDRQLFGE